MDLDSIVTFKRILNQTEFSKTDVLLLLSAIKNKNIDINISLRDNLSLVSEEVTDDILLEYFKLFMSDNQEISCEPVYLLILKHKELRDLLITARKNNLLSDDSLLNIMVDVLTYLTFAGEKDELLPFITKLIKVRKPQIIGEFQSTTALSDFAFCYLDSVLTEEKSETAALVLSLFSMGYVNIYDAYYACNRNDDYIKVLFHDLISIEKYSYLELIINSDTINVDISKILIECIRVYDLARLENQRLDSALTYISKRIDTYLESVNVKKLDISM